MLTHSERLYCHKQSEQLYCQQQLLGSCSVVKLCLSRPSNPSLPILSLTKSQDSYSTACTNLLVTYTDGYCFPTFSIIINIACSILRCIIHYCCLTISFLQYNTKQYNIFHTALIGQSVQVKSPIIVTNSSLFIHGHCLTHIYHAIFVPYHYCLPLFTFLKHFHINYATQI